MDLVTILIQVFIACAMLDVWLIRYNRPGVFRGGDAKTMAEEFEVYGLPVWFRNFIRVAKLSAGAAMIVGIWIPVAAVVAGIGLAVLMAGAVTMHIKVKDPIYKAFPSSLFLVLSLVVAYVKWAAAFA